MANPFNRLPLRSLVVFEAAARHGKFASAATELQMTPARVSQHIAELEATLGVSLFNRRYRGVELTAPGRDLLGAVRHGLQIVGTGFDAAQRLSASRTLTILADFGFAAGWLMPRIDQLRYAMPHVEISLTTVQSGTDFSHVDYDFGILFGDTWPGCRARMIFREQAWPVCAPGLVRGADPRKVLADACLLDLAPQGDQRWFRWADWFGANGGSLPAAHRIVSFNNYQMVMQAAVQGQGAALGWTPLIDDLVAQGQLVRLGDQPLTSERGYFLVEPARAHANPLAGPAIAWLLGALHARSS
ncbi:LysR substrate-binding domain-containing protein [Novosphingobium sp.]|uniref:LysR substrate-binding domain-containing protein n=1 Tax=Novosphingobium sp. TaxID=1874826 RepID=UPI003D112690